MSGPVCFSPAGRVLLDKVDNGLGKSLWLLDVEVVARFWRLEVHSVRWRLDKALQGGGRSRRV
jgi:hypothetical protein